MPGMLCWRAACLAGVLAAAGCATAPRTLAVLHRAGHVSPPCRFEITPTSGAPDAPLGWRAPDRGRDLAALDAWCRATGPAVVGARPVTAAAASPSLTLVSWNLHAGEADLEAFVTRLRAGAYTDGQPVARFVLLLQEAHRGGPDVPRPGGGPTPGRTIRRRHLSADVAGLAARHGLALLYVPSMRNGPARVLHEDRGNAILSTEPLSELEAIELPFERQRRVAVAATIRVAGADGRAQDLRLASVHLDVAASFRRLWFFRARTRQVRGLLSVLPASGPVLVGGDFNTWFGFSDASYRAMAAALPDIAGADRRPTFGPMRLDHVFSRLPDGWSVEARRLDDRLGSDHYPILIRLGANERRVVAAP